MGEGLSIFTQQQGVSAMGLISRLREKWEESRSRRRASRPRSTFRPFLEMLESRVVLSEFFWKPGVGSGDWTNPNNWITTDGGVSYPGDPDVAGSSGDVVKLNTQALGPNHDQPYNITLNQSLTLKQVSLFGDFTPNTLTIGADTSLTVTNEFELFTGELDFGANASLGLKGGHNAWSGGQIGTHGESRGTIYVYGNAIFPIIKDAQQLGANLVVGRDANGNSSYGTALRLNSTGEPTNKDLRQSQRV
jgi:hypothetical protein